ncbi:MAG: DUF4350 domain-containing protein [Bacteroidales bacterium]
MNKKHVLIILILFAALVVLRHLAPKPQNWELSFSGYKKSPYGCKVTKDLLQVIFPNKDIHVNTGSYYITLQDSVSQSNLIIISDHFNPDNLDLNALLGFVAQGNNLFISSLSFPKKLSDTLKFETKESVFDTTLLKSYNEKMRLSYTSGKEDSVFAFPRRMPDHYFSELSKSASLVLGSDRAGRPDFILTGLGKGKIYLHCQPLAFTNYHLLYGNYQYACLALSVLPVSNTIWDQYYKPDRLADTSPVRYILSQAPLRSAYYVLLITLLIYMVFGSRRKQRPVPVIQPLQNTSLNFIRSVGQLYFKSRNHADLAKKKIMYFNEFIRNRYHMQQPFNQQGQSLILSRKSGVEQEFVSKLLQVTGAWEQKNTMDHHELSELHSMIEEFYKKCK